MTERKIKCVFCTTLSVLGILCFISISPGQVSKSSENYADICHVYVVDTAKASKLEKLFFETEDPETDEKFLKLKKETEIVFPQFETKIGEEDLTTKHYSFPNSNLIITASVYYTDESMSFNQPDGKDSSDSMIVGVSVSNKREKSAIGFPLLNSAIAEIPYTTETNKIRVKQYIKVKEKIYLVGLECDCMAKRQNKKEEKR